MYVTQSSALADVTDAKCVDSWQGTAHLALSWAIVAAGPQACIIEVAQCCSIDYIAPEMVTAQKLVGDCDSLAEVEDHTCHVVAADAWALGALVFYAATGSAVVQPDPDDTSAMEDFLSARLSYVQQVHAGWKVRHRPCLHPD